MSYNMQYKFTMALLYAGEGPRQGKFLKGAFMDRVRSWKVFPEVKIHLWAFLDKGRSLKGFHEGNVLLGAFLDRGNMIWNNWLGRA